MAITVAMLTTMDNPWNPFDNWDEWYAYDTRVGHHTTAYLARCVHNSDEISLADQHLVIEQAIDEIVQINANGLYKKVTREISE